MIHLKFYQNLKIFDIDFDIINHYSNTSISFYDALEFQRTFDKIEQKHITMITNFIYEHYTEKLSICYGTKNSLNLDTFRDNVLISAIHLELQKLGYLIEKSIVESFKKLEKFSERYSSNYI